LIGYVFMDTANGLNQGRINMEFWTQLLSEWTCFPNGLPLVSLGAAVAVSGDKSLEWTRLALPVLLLLATCWQMLGTSFGANAMGASTDTDEYWQSREKWTLTQLFNRTGYTSTREGWKNDVYQLATIDQKIYEGEGTEGNDKSLFDRIYQIHAQYLKERETLTTEAERLERYQTYQETIVEIRHEHILKLKSVFNCGIEHEWLIYKEPSQPSDIWFNREENLKWKILITSFQLVFYWVSITGIYNQIYMQDAVREGLRVLDKIDDYAWVCFVLFIVLEGVYYHAQIISGSKSLGSTFGWLFGGCHFDERIETRFDTPNWGGPVILT